MGREYILDSASDLGRQQLDCLQTLLDPQTTAVLDAVGVRPGQRCLDLGAGGGSITSWLADQVEPTGTVVSVDLAIDHITERPGVEVHRHDINDGLPVGGSFDFIHARLVLLHLARREEILKSLVDALAPGGWLVLSRSTFGDASADGFAPSDGVGVVVLKPLADAVADGDRIRTVIQRSLARHGEPVSPRKGVIL